LFDYHAAKREGTSSKNLVFVRTAPLTLIFEYSIQDEAK